MSELPAGWASSPLEGIADVQLGKMLDKIKNKGEPTPYLRNINVRWGAFDLSDVLEMRMSDRERQFFDVRDGDVLVCEGGEPGRAAVWDGGPTALTFQKALMRVRPQEDVEPKYLATYLHFAASTGSLERHFTGTTIKHLTQKALRACKLPLPPLAEQRRIVAKLDALTVRTARARAELNRVPALAERYKHAILAAAFSGDLTAVWQATKNDLNDWSSTNIGGVATITAGFGFPKNRQGKTNGDYPFAKVSDISRVVAGGNSLLSNAANYVDVDDLKILRAKPIPANSIVFAKIGEALRLNRRAITTVPLILDNNCMSLTPNVERILPRYLFYFMRTVDLSPFAVATAVPSVRRGDVAALKLPLPMLEEQAEIVRRIDLAFAEIDRLAAEAAAARRLLDRLDQAILAKAFRGELVAQDPADEPASLLLDRIRAERAAAPAKPRRGRRGAAA